MTALRLFVNKKKYLQGRIRPTSCIFDHDFLRMEAKPKEFYRSRELTFSTQPIYRKFMLKSANRSPCHNIFLVSLQILQKVSFGPEGFMSGKNIFGGQNIVGHEPGHHFNEKFDRLFYEPYCRIKNFVHIL